MNIKFLAAAREEFLAAVEFYEQQEAGLGARLVDSVEKTIETLRQGPHAGVTYSHGTQRLVITHFPFSIVYILEEKHVVIVAVVHQRRKPGYWTDRLESPEG